MVLDVKGRHTVYILPNARPGYAGPDVIFMCYLAPGYVPKLRDMAIHRAGSGISIIS